MQMPNKSMAEVKQWHLAAALIIGLVLGVFFQGAYTGFFWTAADYDGTLTECLESEAFYKEKMLNWMENSDTMLATAQNLGNSLTECNDLVGKGQNLLNECYDFVEKNETIVQECADWLEENP